MEVDYIIVGQGICGTFLSWNLLKEGKSVLMIDESRPFSSTKVASGVINPVTGRRIVKTWMIDEVLPFGTEQYLQFGREMGVELIKQCNVLQFHATPQMRDAFIERYESDKQYLDIADEDRHKPYFNFNYGVGEIDPCMLINLNLMLDQWRSSLKGNNNLLEEAFDNNDLAYTQDSVIYRNITAKKIIFCNGTDTFELPYFSLLPYAKNKGEAVLAEIPELPKANIYKQALSIVPWKNNIFWIGSTYEWKYDDLDPTPIFRNRVEQILKFWLKLPFKIVDHIASERPATVERRPFVGLHPVHSSIGIFNGMGTKGCSLAPYFAYEFAQHLIYNSPLNPEADIQRFKRILSSVKM